MPIPKPILKQRDYILDHVERIASPLWDGDIDGHPDFPTMAGLQFAGATIPFAGEVAERLTSNWLMLSWSVGLF